MGAKGRKKLPLTLKISAKGIRAPDRDESFLVAPQSRPVCPEHFGSRARAAWDRIAGQLESLNMLSASHTEALACFADAVAEVEEACETIAREGRYVSGQQGTYMHPAVKVRNAAAARVLQYSRQFGLTPASQSKVLVKTKKKQSEKERLFNKASGL